jgi:cytochrome c-type biogenesis protein CcmH/NrfG
MPQIVVGLALVAMVALIFRTLSERHADHWQEVVLGRYYLERGQFDRALKAVAGIHDGNPGAAEGLTIAARSFLMKGGISTAKKALERSLTIEPDQAEAAKMLAAIYLASGDGRRGITLLELAAKLDPGDFRPWYAMGKVHHDLGELEESADCYAEALKRSPPQAEAAESRLGEIRALLDSKQNDRAGALIEEARNGSPDDPVLLSLAGRQAYGQGSLNEAQELAEKALAADPRNFDALMIRARARFIARQPELAVVDLKQAVLVRPQDIGALQFLAQIQNHIGLVKESAATQARADRARDRVMLMDRLAKDISKYPDDPRPRWLMGQAAMEGEMLTLAYECFQAAIDLDPGFQPARDSLKTLQTEKGYDPNVTGNSSFPILTKGRPGKP